MQKILVLLFSIVLVLRLASSDDPPSGFHIDWSKVDFSRMDWEAFLKKFNMSMDDVNMTPELYAQLQTDRQTYQTPYKNAITTMAVDIIEYLARSPIPTSIIESRQIVSDLNVKSQLFTSQIGSASESSNTVRQKWDQQIESIVAQSSTIERQIAEKSQQIAPLTEQLNQGYLRISEAGDQARKARESLRLAEIVFHQAEEEVEKNRRCLLGCRFWACKKTCGLINGGGIDGAKSDRNRASDEVTACQKRVDDLQSAQNLILEKQTALYNEQQNLEKSKSDSGVQLTQLNRNRDRLIGVDTQLKNLILHIRSLFGKSEILVEVIKNLIDAESIINPLSAIGDQIIGYTTIGEDKIYLTNMKEKIAANLPLVIQKLPQYALIV